MKPIEFQEMTGVFPASNTRKTPTPVHIVGDQWNQVITCWKLSEQEAQELMQTNILWIRQLQLNSPNLQPILPQIRKPIFELQPV